MSARTLVLDALEQLMGDDVRVIRGPRPVDDLDARPIAVARTVTYNRLPEAPLTHVQWAGVLTIVSPKRDVIKAEDQLEAIYEALLPVARTGQFILGEATLSAFGENADGSPKYLCLEAQITSIFTHQE